jgi:hypothetical protein
MAGVEKFNACSSDVMNELNETSYWVCSEGAYVVGLH